MRISRLLTNPVRRPYLLPTLTIKHSTALGLVRRYNSASMSKPSDACCSIPPVVSSGYSGKGDYKSIRDLKTYITGPGSATEAILVIYDIFGFFPQTIQGADILAASNPDRKYRVFIPDFFEGSPADISWYPPQTEEQKQKLSHFFQAKAIPLNTLSKIRGFIAEADLLAPGGAGFKKWAVIGYCWGAKVANLAVGTDNVCFKAAVQCHPSMVNPEDAKQVTVPMAILASKDEPAEAVRAYQENLKVPNYLETFPTQIHGWMAARANLDDPEVRKEYERGYRSVLKFLHLHF